MLKGFPLPAPRKNTMRNFALLLIFASFFLPAFAITRVTVAELEKTIDSSQGWSDKGAAERLAGMELTERLSKARYERLKVALPGEKARLALLALADGSAFLDLPPTDTLPLAKPDIHTQGKIVSRAADFVVATVSKMPDFFASRTTTRFQDMKVIHGSDEPIAMPNHGFIFIDKVNSTILFRLGREVVEPLAAKKADSNPAAGAGLANLGVFGPILGVVMADILKGKIGWGHWEQGPGGPLAVFRYAIAADRSNYSVRYCCFRSELGDMRQFEATPAYHGEIAIDPATGSVLRLVVKTDLEPKLPIDRADVVVDYGPVNIGGKTYICPLESTSISRAEATILQGDTFYVRGRFRSSSGDNLDTKKIARLPRMTAVNNDVFADYHQFRGDVRMVTRDSSEEEKGPQAPAPSPQPQPPPQR